MSLFDAIIPVIVAKLWAMSYSKENNGVSYIHDQTSIVFWNI